MGLVKAMSKSLIRSKLEALKNGISSEEEEGDDDYYDEEEQDNFDEEAMNDFVVEDQDVGYKASAHQKVSQSKNKSNRRNKPRQKASQTQSYSIGRKRIKTNNKNQSTMKSFFKKAPTNTSKLRLSSNRNRKVHHQKQKKQKTKQKKKKTMILWIILWQIWIRTMMMMIL